MSDGVGDPTRDPTRGAGGLDDRRALGVRLGLEVITAVYEALGRPGSAIPTIHVVGTNGKGSTAHLLEHALRARGRRTGLYTSPHLHRVGERIRVNGRPTGPEALQEVLRAVQEAEQRVDRVRSLSYFELLTLAGLVIFARSGLDALVVEAGMGGGRDATRIVRAHGVVITSIGLDHQAMIGPTLVDIAREKAGAMAPGVPTWTAPQEPAVIEALRTAAAAVGSALEVVEPAEREPRGLPGAHQRINAALARAAGRRWIPDLTLADLDGVRIPGRLERIAHAGGELWLDVAHNPAAMDAVVAAIESGQVPRPAWVVFGCHPDKDRAGMEARLDRLGCPRWWITPPGPAPMSAAPDPWPRIEAALQAGQRVLACGSHAVVALLRARARGDTTPADLQDPRPGERP